MRLNPFISLAILCISAFLSTTATAQEKARLIVTTDLGGSDPDDIQSMIHLLVCSDRVDIEGLISSQAWVNDPDKTPALKAVVDSFIKVLPSLAHHSSGFPDADHLKSIVVRGQEVAHMDGVGDGKDSPGSELIIKSVTNPSDHRPVWLTAWGGMNTIAQALWKMRQTMSPDSLAFFASKIRIYDILGQDDAGAWIAHNFPQILYIRNKDVYGWAPDDQWTRQNVQSRLPLGASYPNRVWATEGDSPAFLYLIANGLNCPEHPDYGGWGGRFSLTPVKNVRGMDFIERSGKREDLYDDYFMIGSASEGNDAIKRWKSHICNDFAARMIWASDSCYENANHYPVVSLNGLTSWSPLIINATPGEVVRLSAEGSSDPDGDNLMFNWSFFREPSSFDGFLDIEGSNSEECSILIPENSVGTSIHIILEVTDSGYPSLTSYRRIIINSFPVPEKPTQLKPRIVVLTDIAPGDREPDDMESMVRLLCHADLFEIEALVTCSGWNNSGHPYGDEWAAYLHQAIDAYEKDLPNLMKRSGQSTHLPIATENLSQEIGYWPSADYLRSRHVMGSRNLGVDQLGVENASAGSNEIIRLAEENDDRPLWILVWGGANTLAQSLWQLKEEGDSGRIGRFLDKIRVYTITDQDVDWMNRENYDLSSHKWMRQNFGGRLFFLWDESAWLSHCEMGASRWDDYAAMIQTDGNLGSVYPKYKYGVEGDTPSFLYVLPNGLNMPDSPEAGSWGGYFQYELSPDSLTSCYTNKRDDIRRVSRKYEEYFYPAIFNNFAARMQWATTGSGNRNPEVVINGQSGLSPVVIDAKPGESIRLSAEGSSDPDGDAMDFKWWIMQEAADSLPDSALSVIDPLSAVVTIPADSDSKEVHIICECTDSAAIPLTAYRRIILRIN